MQPDSFSIKAFYSKQVKAAKKDSPAKQYFVSIERDKKGTVMVNPSTTGQTTGEVRLGENELDYFNKFVKEAQSNFAQIVTVNQALITPRVEEKESK